MIVEIGKRGYEQSVIKYTIDACAFLRNKRRNPFADLFYKLFGLANYSNMNHTCPYDVRR